MFVPVSISIGTGGETGTLYHRGFDVPEKLDAFGRRTADMSEPLGTIGASLRDIVKGQFVTEGGTGATGKWKPLSETYGAWKERKVPGLPVLIGIRKTGGKRPNTTYARSGQMMLQLLDPLSTHVTQRRLLYTPDSNIAGWHESGTSRMPARPPVDLRLSDLRVFDRTFVAWVSRLIKESGL